VANPVGITDFFMPFDQAAIVAGIRPALLETHSALVEVATSCDLRGRRFVYTIVKGGIEPSGLQYTLTLHLESEGPARFHIQGFFSERGTTGAREPVVLELTRRDGTVRDRNGVLEGWRLGTYDDVQGRPSFQSLRIARLRRDVSQPSIDTGSFVRHGRARLRAVTVRARWGSPTQVASIGMNREFGARRGQLVRIVVGGGPTSLAWRPCAPARSW